MFDQLLQIFQINDFFLSTVKHGSSNGSESYEKYRNPALLDRKSDVTTGCPALRLDAVKVHTFNIQYITMNRF